MKKLGSFLLVLVYMMVSSGIVLHTHYCMGELIGTDILTNSTEACPSCGMETNVKEKSDCCKDNYNLLKIDKDQKVSDNNVQITKSISAIIINFISEISIFRLPSITESKPTSNSPPVDSIRPIYKQVCVYRI